MLVSLGSPVIPDGLIMKRWTREARDGIPVGSDAYVDAHGDSSDLAAMHCFIYASAMELVAMATKSRPAFEVAVDYVNRAKLAVSSMTVVPSEPQLDETTDPSVATNNLSGVGATILAPPRVRSRGRPKKTRFKSPIESPGARKKRKPAGPPTTSPAPRRSRRNKSAEETRKNVPKCRTCSSIDHYASKCPLNNVEQPRGLSTRKCTTCGCTGHNRSTCGRKSSYTRREE